MFLQGRAGYRWVVDKVVEIAADHGEEALAGTPLGRLLTSGEPSREIVHEACLAQRSVLPDGDGGSAA